MELSTEQWSNRVKELEQKIEEYEQFIDAIKGGEIDGFALNKNNQHEIFTFQGSDAAYRILVENFLEGAVTISEDALIVYTNGYFHEMLSLPYESVIGKSFLQFIHADSKNTFNDLFKKGFAGQSKGEINLIAGEKMIPVYVSLTSLYPNLHSIGIIVTDLTEKRIAEEEIKNKTAQLEAKNIQLEKLNKELKSFAYVSSHDLQEPLRKIQTFATRILEKDYNNISDSGKDHFNRMQSAARRMQTLIEDLLEYSRTETAERKFEFADLNKVVGEVVEELNEEIKNKRAIVETAGLGHINIIPFQFFQLMYNLISNALKFANSQQPPHIKIESITDTGTKFNRLELSPEKKYCHITVTDNGIGFEPEYSEKIFELFQRLHGKAEYKGTGIGLSIVKKIVENHGGIITAEGAPGKGATFNIYIPAN